MHARPLSALVLFCPLVLVACGDDSAVGNNINTNVNNTNVALCGNAVVEALEECDLGAANDDLAPDTCRTTCRLPACGDSVIDTGEVCDQGPQNSAVTPDACRPGCILAACGDGVVDVVRGESCDPPNAATCDAECHVIVPFCGNHVLDASEVCDDGNNVGGDGCSANCLSLETCGNGHLDLAAGEECDDANALTGDGCGPTCLLERCGNGLVDPGEACDDGDNDSGDGCSANCLSRETCGNGIVDTAAGEECDDANAVDGDGCSTDCLREYCGNHVVDEGEECDDGNYQGGDGCGPTCLIEACGNAFVDGGEECDDGTPLNSDAPNAACRADCTLRGCGDGIVDDLQGEECDSGTANSDTTPDACRTTCRRARCGDHLTDPLRGETCDDGNTMFGDGCSGLCRTEGCGNGILDVGEECDDGTDLNSDEPNATCRVGCVLRGCGDGIADDAQGEECDGAPPANVDCSDLGYYRGNVACTATCRTDAAGCEGECGDGVADLASGEECDVDDMGGDTCDAHGYYGGDLDCQTNCKVALGGCVGRCGDGFKNGTEVCDGVDFGGVSCADYGYYTGSLACSSDCRTITQQCEQTCGDGIKNGLEECDGTDTGGYFCADSPPFVAGVFGCAPDCTLRDDTCFAPGWSIHSSGTLATLYRIWGSAYDDVWAVGSGGTIVRYDGISWSLVPSPTTSDLLGVFTAGPDDVFITSAIAIYHWDGNAFTTMDTGGVGAQAMWGAASNDVWAVGNGGKILHWNGSTWMTVPSGTTTDLADIFGSAPDNIVVRAAATSILRWNGSSWSPMPNPPGFGQTVTTGPNDVFTSSGFGPPHSYHWNGTSWSNEVLPAVWDSRGTFALPSGQIITASNYGEVLIRDGTWRAETTGTTEHLKDSWGTSINNIWVVGTVGKILHYGGPGSGWRSTQPDPAIEFRSVWMASPTVGFAIGSPGTVYRYNGSTWSLLTSSLAGELWDVWGFSENEVYLAGDDTVLRYNGTSWSSVSGAPSGRNAGIWGTSGTNLYVVQDWGGIRRFNGTSWQSITPPNNGCGTPHLKGIWGTGPDDIFAVGWCGRIVHWNGTTWSVQPSGLPDYQRLDRVRGRSGSDVYAVGDLGTILHYDGVSWQPMDSGTSAYIVGIWVSATGDVFAVGESGTILWLAQGRWTPMRSDTYARLYNVHGTSSSDFWAVGSGGTISHFTGLLPHLPWCGDAIVQTQDGEECDDGNAVSGDGCEPDCTFTCASGSGAQRVALDPATGNCLARISTGATWANAEDNCVALGGHLVTIDSAEKNALVYSISGPHHWIGLNDVTTEGAFTWASGASLGYSHWAESQPDNYNNEDCVEFYLSDGWNDRPCTDEEAYVCEIAYCGDGSVQSGRGEECDDGNLTSADGCSATCTCEVPGSGSGAPCAGTSCQQILQDGLSRGSGVYWLDPAATGTAFQTYCDMVTAGGGWTLVATYGTEARPATWSGSSYPRPGASQYGSVSSRIFEAVNNGTAIGNFSIDAADLWTLSNREVLAYVGGTTDDYVTGQLPAGCNFFDGSTWCAESTYGPFEVRRSNGTTLTSNGYACTTAHRAAPYAADDFDEFGLHLLDGPDTVAGYNCQRTASTLGHQAHGRIFTSFNQASGVHWNLGIHSHWATSGLANQPGALLVR